MKTSEVLNKSADLIEERGWTTGVGWPSKHRPKSGLCLEGGIMAAVGHNDFNTVDLSQFWICPAYRAVLQYLGRDDTLTLRGNDQFPSLAEPLWMWNDHGRTAAEVIETLHAAAVIEAAKETADERESVTA